MLQLVLRGYVVKMDYIVAADIVRGLEGSVGDWYMGWFPFNWLWVDEECGWDYVNVLMTVSIVSGWFSYVGCSA